jgi:predicted ATPase
MAILFADQISVDAIATTDSDKLPPGVTEKEAFAIIKYHLGEVLKFADRHKIAVCLEEFGSEDILKKAKEDLSWIKEKALAHEKVIEQAMRQNGNVLSVIPMKFGTIFKDEKGLEEVLDKDYFKIEKNLERIRGKQEWSVKVYLMDREKFGQAVKEKNESIKEKEEEMASLPEGMAAIL